MTEVSSQPMLKTCPRRYILLHTVAYRHISSHIVTCPLHTDVEDLPTARCAAVLRLPLRGAVTEAATGRGVAAPRVALTGDAVWVA